LRALTSTMADAPRIVSSIATPYLVVSFIVTCITPLLVWLCILTRNDFYWKLAFASAPFGALFMVLSIFARPQAGDGYERFLYVQFGVFSVISELGLAVGVLGGEYSEKVKMIMFIVIRLSMTSHIFVQGLRIRRICAKKPASSQSAFLTDTILLRGSEALFGMMFLAFETVSCLSKEGGPGSYSLTKEDGLDSYNGKCDNSIYSSSSLCVVLSIVLIHTAASRSCSEAVQEKSAVTFSDLASLRFRRWHQRVNVVNITAATVSCLYLLSYLGVSNPDNDWVVRAGAIAMTVAGVAAFLDIFFFLRDEAKLGERARGGDGTGRKSSARRVSTGNLTDGMVLGAVI